MESIAADNQQQNWNFDSGESEDEQRRRLIRHYVEGLDEIPRTWDTVRESAHNAPKVLEPSQQQINTILAPWRSPEMRLTAAKIWVAGPERQINVLRTHYARDPATRAEHDEKLRSWLETALNDPSPPYDTVEEASRWLFLSDERLFDVGDRWQDVMEVLPELFGPFGDSYGDVLARYPPFDPRNGTARLEQWQRAREELRGEVAEASGLEDRLEALDNGDEFLQYICICTVVMVADEQAFKTGELLAVFVDERGNEIRSSRCGAEEDWWGLRADAFGGALESNPWWNGEADGSRKGDKYGRHGEIGKTLYGVEDLLQEAEEGE